MKEKLKLITKRICQAAEACGRNPESVRLVAVSKTVSAGRVREAVDAGVTVLGENYIQEASEKISALSDCNVSWHFIGHLQSNKAKYAVRLFDLIHTVDSLKLANELNRQAANINKIQNILVQVNIGNEESKSGTSAEELQTLLREIGRLTHLSVKGLMTIPPFYDEAEKVRPFFSAIRELQNQIKSAAIPNISMDELSMGMSGDFETAIEEGATLVRIGTAVFGERNLK